MAKIAFILLCHKDPEAVVAQAQRLTAVGDCVAIHYDARAPGFDAVRTALRDDPRVTFAARRVKCGWGEWSLVEATLLAVRAAVTAFPDATHFYMLSGDCMAIKSARYAHAFLDADDVDYIESFDFFRSGWIKTGMQGERLLYRHYFNERKHKALFYASVEVQRRLGLARRIPDDLQVMIGSQWWCLRRQTIEDILQFLNRRRDVLRFFRRSWIPDETFFQTLVPHLVPECEIRTRSLTFLMFTDYGMPVTFYDDHYDLLLSQDYLFARKISPEATTLRARLGELYASDTRDFHISNEGRGLFRYLTGRGRIGRRYGPRFWETEGTVGQERELLILVCKKYHVAKRLIGRIREATGLPCIDYLFDEEDTPLPDLGGTQTTIAKRTRHRRALMRMLCDYFGSDRLVFCLDPANIDLMKDFYGDRATTRFLEIDVDFSDDYLAGHARRIGLAGDRTSPETLQTLVPTLRADVRFEIEQMRNSDFATLSRISQGSTADANAGALARFLDISHNEALEIARTDNLFSD